MTLEQWILIGTIAAAIVAIITIFKVPIEAIKWYWGKWQKRKKNILSNEEKECICEFESQDAPLEWSDGMEKRKLKICEGLVKRCQVPLLSDTVSKRN